MCKSIFYKIGWFFVIILMTTNGYADTTTTLDRLVGEVLERNPEIQFYRAEIEAAKGARTTAGTWANPEVGGSFGQKKVWSGGEDGDTTTKGKAFDISIMQPIEWPGRLGLRKAIAQRDIELAELGLEQFRALLQIRAKVALYHLFAAREVQAATQEVSNHFRTLKEVLSQRSPAGLTPLLETRVIETMELNTQRKATQASIAAQEALNEWNLLRGVPAGADFPLSSITVDFKPLKENKDALTSLVLLNDYAVRQRTIELERQNSRLGLAENERMPTVSIGPVISQEKASDKERMIGGAVSVPLPLWNQNQGNVRVEKARRVQSEVSLDLAKRDAENRLSLAMVAYERKFKEISGWKPEAIQHFKEAAELADRHYRLGSVPVTVYVELQTQYLEALQGLHDTRVEALDVAGQLELLTGSNLALANVDIDKK